MVREYIGVPSEVRSDSSPTYCSEDSSAHTALYTHSCALKKRYIFVSVFLYGHASQAFYLSF